MKKMFISALSIALAFGSVHAQTADNNAQHPTHQRIHHQHRRFNTALQKLNLTENQKSQLKGIREKYHQQLVDLKKNNQLTAQALQENKKSLRKDFRTQMESILTQEQKDQLAQMKTEWKEKRKEGKNNSSAFTKHSRHLQQELGLSNNQKAKMAQIRKDFKGQYQSVRNDQSLSASDKTARLHEVKKEQHTAMKAVLTPDQIQKLQSLRKNSVSDNTK